MRTTLVDTLVIGQGIAGTAVAWALQQRNTSFAIVDPGEKHTASAVAAGLITPVTGTRYTVAADFESLHDIAVDFYQSIEQRLEHTFLSQRSAWRFCYTPDEVDRFEKRAPDLVKRGVVVRESHDRFRHASSPFRVPRLAFSMPHAARLNTAAYLRSSRQWFHARDRLVEHRLDVSTLRYDRSDGRWGAPLLPLRARRVVFCRGHSDEANQWLPSAKFNCAKGEILSVDIDCPSIEQTVHAHKSWLCPSNEAGRYLFGATYQHAPYQPGNSRAARAHLSDRLSQLVNRPFSVVNQLWGVRPIAVQRKAIVGRHRDQPSVAWLNGLGSKGVLLAPYLADRLVDSLLTDRAFQAPLTGTHNA
ncbi:MAG: FAD-dependent oxidoreductase [Pseudomonadota bacterium]